MVNENQWWNFSFFLLHFHKLIRFLTVIILETRIGWLISWPSRKHMLLSPQDLPGFHILKKSLKGLCGSLSSSCPLCRWGGCWLGPAGLGACRKGVFLSCKGGDNREKKDRTCTHCIGIICVYVYLPQWTMSRESATGLGTVALNASYRHLRNPAQGMTEWRTLRWMDGLYHSGSGENLTALWL